MQSVDVRRLTGNDVSGQTLERVQKAAVKIILKSRYTNYKEGLNYLKMDSLDERRRLLCLKFAKNCLKIEKVKGMFKKKTNLHKMKKRKQKYYEESKTRLISIVSKPIKL